MCSNFPIRDFSRCTVCEGRFGLVRYYSWQAVICSKKCAGRLRDRRENNRRWLALGVPPSDFSHKPGFETYQGMSSLNP